MTYVHLCLSPEKLMSDNAAIFYFVAHTANKLQHAPQHDARLHCRISPFQRTPANHRIFFTFTLPETRVPELHDSCYRMGLSLFTFTQLFLKAKKRCSRRALTPDTTVLNIFFLENPSEYLTLPETRVLAEDLRR